MHTYTSDRFSYNAASKTLTAAASDLGLKPGTFPRRIEIKHRGIGVVMADTAEKAAGGELSAVHYRQTNGPCLAVILND